MPEWQGYTPGTAEALAAAERYRAPAGIIQEAPLTSAPFRGAGGAAPGPVQYHGAGVLAGAGVVGPVAPTPGPAILPPVGALAPAAAAVGVAIPPALLAILGLAGAAYGAYQGLGGGEGGGLFGLNVLGGDEFQMGGLEFGGPGLPEPTAPYTEWRAGNKQFYYVPVYSPTTGKFLRAKVAMYNRDSGKWKVWTLPKPHLAVIGKNAPSHRMLTRLRHNLRRHTADAKTILQVASPAYYAKMSGYYKPHKHYKGHRR